MAQPRRLARPPAGLSSRPAGCRHHPPPHPPTDPEAWVPTHEVAFARLCWAAGLPVAIFHATNPEARSRPVCPADQHAPLDRLLRLYRQVGPERAAGLVEMLKRRTGAQERL